MDAIQSLFSKNARWRNILFLISFPLMVILFITWGFLGARYIYSAPLVTAIMLTGLALKPPRYYIPTCVGALLSFSLFQSLMGYLIVGPVMGVFIYLAIGIVGYALLMFGVYQAVFGTVNLSRINQIILNIIIATGFGLFLLQLIVVEKRGIKPEETPKYRTY